MTQHGMGYVILLWHSLGLPYNYSLCSFRKDVKGFFAEPITNTIAPGYSKRILDPMDFSTMESKIERNEYGSIMGYKVQMSAEFKSVS